MTPQPLKPISINRSPVLGIACGLSVRMKKARALGGGAGQTQSAGANQGRTQKGQASASIAPGMSFQA
jgi:hypothetical protein